MKIKILILLILTACFAQAQDTSRSGSKLLKGRTYVPRIVTDSIFTHDNENLDSLTHDIADSVAMIAIRTDSLESLIGKQFLRVENFGGSGDAVALTGLSITATNDTLTSATAVFVSSDVGKYVIVYTAGTSGNELIAQILTFVSTTKVELLTAASTTASSKPGVMGTANNTAFNSLLASVPIGEPVGIALETDARYLILPPPNFAAVKITRDNVLLQGNNAEVWGITSALWGLSTDQWGYGLLNIGTATVSSDLDTVANVAVLNLIGRNIGQTTSRTTRTVTDAAISSTANVVTDGAMSSSVNPTTLTSATANFLTTDVGLSITVSGAGAAGATLSGTIISRTNATTVILSTPCLTTVTNATVTLDITVKLTSATAAFTSADSGLGVLINGAGVDGFRKGGVISSIISSTAVKLTTSANTTVSGVKLIIGDPGLYDTLNGVVQTYNRRYNKHTNHAGMIQAWGAKDITIENVTSYECGSLFGFTTSTRRVYINNSKIYGWGTIGIAVPDQSVITNNRIDNSTAPVLSQADFANELGATQGIYIVGGSDFWTVANNHISRAREYGIQANSGSVMWLGSIVNNVIDSCYSGGVVDGANTHRIDIIGNKIVRCTIGFSVFNGELVNFKNNSLFGSGASGEVGLNILAPRTLNSSGNSYTGYTGSNSNAIYCPNITSGMRAMKFISEEIDSAFYGINILNSIAGGIPDIIISNSVLRNAPISIGAGSWAENTAASNITVSGNEFYVSNTTAAIQSLVGGNYHNNLFVSKATDGVGFSVNGALKGTVKPHVFNNDFIGLNTRNGYAFIVVTATTDSSIVSENNRIWNMTAEYAGSGGTAGKFHVRRNNQIDGVYHYLQSDSTQVRAFKATGNTVFASNGTPGSGKVATGTDGNGAWTWQTTSDTPVDSANFAKLSGGNVFAGSQTAPIIVGGTGTTSTLTLQPTSGVGTTNADIIFKTGNNGATEKMRIAHGGTVSVINSLITNSAGSGVTVWDGVDLYPSNTNQILSFYNSGSATSAIRLYGGTHATPDIIEFKNNSVTTMTISKAGLVNIPDSLTANTIVARIIPRYGSTTSSATPTINTDNVDVYELTAQAADITSFTTNLSGTPTTDQVLHLIIVGTAARAITWGASFEASTIALPTTTVSTNRLDVYFVWNSSSSKWRCGGTW